MKQFVITCNFKVSCINFITNHKNFNKILHLDRILDDDNDFDDILQYFTENDENLQQCHLIRIYSKQAKIK